MEVADMDKRPVFDPDSDYSRDLAEGIRQARIPRQARFCIAEDAGTAGGICGRPSSPADPNGGCVNHPTVKGPPDDNNDGSDGKTVVLQGDVV
jgi:hypothetical protein